MINLTQRAKDRVMKDLNSFIDDLINRKNYLEEKLANYNKDEEIQKYKKKYEAVLVNSLHTLSEQEAIDAKAFRTEHWESCKGNTRYILEGTGIGTAVTVQCTKCNETKNITDVSSW